MIFEKSQLDIYPVFRKNTDITLVSQTNVDNRFLPKRWQFLFIEIPTFSTPLKASHEPVCTCLHVCCRFVDSFKESLAR